MSADIIARAVVLLGTIGTTSRRHAFQHAVRDFIALLTVVPDAAATDFSNEEIGALMRMADRVIAHIEERVSTNDESTAVQLELVGAVYEIRRRVELIDQWRRHFLGHS